MKIDLRKVLYYETFKNNQRVKLYILDKNEPSNYRIELISDYDEIKRILPIINKDMIKIEGIAKNGIKTYLTHKYNDGTEQKLEYERIDINHVNKVYNDQNRMLLEEKNKEIEKANKKKTKAYVALALSAMILLGTYALKNNKDKEYKEPLTISTIEPTMVPTVRPTVKPTTVPTVKPTAIPTIAPTVAPTVNPTQVPSTIEQERKIDFGIVSTPMPIAAKDIPNVEKLTKAANEVAKLDTVGTRVINKEIFTDPTAIAAAIKIINGDFDFKETVVDENNAFKGILFIHAATSAYALNDIEDMRLSKYIEDDVKASEVRKVEEMLRTNNEKGMIDQAKIIERTTSYDTKEIDFINVSYIASASRNFYKEKSEGEFLSKLQNDLMVEINMYCFDQNPKTR